MSVVVFDSGLGSLSIIKEIQKKTKCEIIYIADQKNFPYGKKSSEELSRIIKKTLEKINRKFKPKIIVLASNTPSLLLRNKIPKNVINVLPPLKNIEKLSKTNNIAILATQSVVNSSAINNYIKENRIKIIGEPKPQKNDNIDKIKINEIDSFNFDFKIGHLSDFKLKPFKKSKKYNLFNIKVDKKTTDQTIENLKVQYADINNLKEVTSKSSVYC